MVIIIGKKSLAKALTEAIAQFSHDEARGMIEAIERMARSRFNHYRNEWEEREKAEQRGKESAAAEINERIKSEAFIDDIVDRIRKKQLSRG